MSDYVHGRKMSTCPRDGCDGEDCDRRKYRFKCDQCGMKFP